MKIPPAQQGPISSGGGPAGHTRKHSRTHGSKHNQTAHKHHPLPPQSVFGGGGGPPVVAKAPQHKKPRQLSPGWDVACCSAQAVGTLLGWDHSQVLALYWRTARDPDSGASIADTIAAARIEYLPGVILGVTLPEPHALAVTPDGRWWSWGELFDPDDWPDLTIEERVTL